MDLVLAGNGGPRLLIQQPDGRLVDATVEASAGGVFTGAGYFGVWAADIEMDGDLDIVAGANDDTAIVLRNNGNGTWRRLAPFGQVVGARAFVWGDVDRDGDPDPALLDAEGRLHIFVNQQAGQFRHWPAPDGLPRGVAVTVGDGKADGQLEQGVTINIVRVNQ